MLRAVLDADVLWPMVLRDTLLRLGNPDLGLYDPVWSEAILDEVARTTVQSGRVRPERIRRTIELMQEAFPESSVDVPPELVHSISVPDPNDRHVVAAARAGKASMIVTNNTRDFPAEDVGRDLEVVTPDDLLHLLYRQATGLVLDSLAFQVAGYRTAPRTFRELLQSFKSAGLERTAYTMEEEADLDDLELAIDEHRAELAEGIDRL